MLLRNPGICIHFKSFEICLCFLLGFCSVCAILSCCVGVLQSVWVVKSVGLWCVAVCLGCAISVGVVLRVSGLLLVCLVMIGLLSPDKLVSSPRYALR